MDGRNRANIIVRESLTDALFQLMAAKDFADITVSELVQRAGVSRNSFYRNYRDMQDIIVQHMHERKAQWWAHYVQHPHGHLYEEIFAHLLRMKDLLMLLESARLSHLIFQHIQLDEAERLSKPIAAQYRDAFWAGAVWGIANAWIARGMQETPAEMEEIVLTYALGTGGIDTSQWQA